jgi:hypothetical protein
LSKIIGRAGGEFGVGRAGAELEQEVPRLREAGSVAMPAGIL